MKKVVFFLCAVFPICVYSQFELLGETKPDIIIAFRMTDCEIYEDKIDTLQFGGCTGSMTYYFRQKRCWFMSYYISEGNLADVLRAIDEDGYSYWGEDSVKSDVCVKGVQTHGKAKAMIYTKTSLDKKHKYRLEIIYKTLCGYSYDYQIKAFVVGK